MREYTCVRSTAAISIPLISDNVPDLKAQVILRLYKTPSEILHGFDLGSCAVGFDGKNILMTSLGEFCHTYSVNIVDTTRRSTTYEPRLVKYLQRGFKIVTPYLDVNKIKSAKPKVKKTIDPIVDEVLMNIKKNDDTWDKTYETHKLYNLHFKVEEKEGNCILLRMNGAIQFPSVGTYVSDYDDGEPSGTTIWKNLRALSHIKMIDDEWRVDNDFPFSWYFEFEDGFPVFENIMKIPLDELKSSLVKKLVEFFHGYVKNRKSNPMRDKMEGPFVKFLKPFCKSIDIVGGLESQDWKSFAKSAFKQQIETINAIFSSLERQQVSSDIPWKTINPGSQLTGSFNPIIGKPEDWYRDLYKGTSKLTV